MAEAPIKHTDIYEDDLFGNLEQSGERALAVIRQLETGIKDLSKVAGKNSPVGNPKTIADAEKINQSLTEQRELLKGKLVVEKQIVDLVKKEEERQARKRATDEVKASLSAYTRLSLEYRKAAKAAQDLAAADVLAGKAFSQQTKEAVFRANELNNQLKRIDVSIGNNQRNVGNYTKSIVDAGKGAFGLSRIITALGSAFGFNTSALQTTTDAIHELVRGAKDLRDIGKASTLATQANTVATEVNTVATEANTVATTKAGIGQRIYQGIIAGTTKALKSLTTTQGALNASLVAIAVALAANAYRLYQQIQLLGDADSILTKWTDSNNNAAYALELLNRQQEQNITNLIESSKLQESILQEQGASEEKIFAQRQKTFNLEQQQLKLRRQNILDQIGLQQKYLEKLQLIGRTVLADNPNTDPEKLKKDNELFKKTTDLIDSTSESINELGAQYDELTGQLGRASKQQELLNLQFANAQRQADLLRFKQQQETEEILAQDRFNNSQETIADEIKLQQELFKIKQAGLEAQQALFSPDSSEYKAYSNQLLQLEIDSNEKVQELKTKLFLEGISTEQELRKKSFDAAVEASDFFYKQDKYNAELTIKNKEKRDRKILELELERLKTQLDFAKQYGQDTLKIQEQIYDAEIALMRNAEDTYKKTLERRISFFEKVYNAVFNRLDARAEEIRKANTQYISELDRQIETQNQLAINGQRNVLDFLSRKRAEALEEQAKLDEQQRKRENAKEFASLFIKLYGAYAEKGDINASLKALGDTLKAKAISDGIANAFKDGVEGVEGPGTGTSDSIHAKISKGESVLTAKGTAETSGLATAVNKKGKAGAMEWFYKNMVTPELPSKKQLIEQAQTDMVVKELRKGFEMIKNKREFALGVNGDGEVETLEKMAGIVKYTTHKRSPIIERRPKTWQ